MKKKLLVLLLAVALIVTMSVVFVSCDNNDDFKVGVILVGDETEGYTEAHIEGIKSAATALGLKDNQIIWKYKVGEDETCTTAANDLVAQGCSIIFSNSYGHQSFMEEAAKSNPSVTFVSMTGDYASISGLSNYKNAFTNVYEARYVSGVVAGLKIKELVEANALSSSNYSSGKVKVGYVGAYPYAEVVSGYTAFFLGIQSVYADVIMDVQYTSSWFDYDSEAEAANTLVGRGCVIIGQHADSTGSPSKVQSLLDAGSVCYSVGYNVDMLGVASTAALTSSTNNWSVYYEYAIGAAMKGETIATDWAKGYSDSAVGITKLGTSCATGTQAKVNEVVAAIKDGSLKVFDCSKFTVEGAAKTSYDASLDHMNADYSAVVYAWTASKNAIVTNDTVSYFSESTLRSAPYFDLRIDGITELN